VKSYQWHVIWKEYLSWQAYQKSVSASARPALRSCPPFIPSGAPLDRTYTWYAPVNGYRYVPRPGPK
jgi:hypothetical protein